MNKHTLGYGIATLFFASTITATSIDLHKKNDTILEINKEVESLNAENKDVMSTNSQLSEKVELLELNIEEMQQQLKADDLQIEKLSKEKDKLLNELQESKGSWSTFTATYYDADFESTGKRPGHPYYGVTASGEKVKEGVTVAVDPNVIPLGTWLEVKYPDGRVEKRKAMDTGGAIKGKKIDIYIASANNSSGKHPVQVRVIN